MSKFLLSALAILFPISCFAASTGSTSDLFESATNVLKSLRESRAEFCDIELIILDSNVRRGGFSLQDIGTSKEEIDSLRVKCKEELARGNLTNLRYRIGDFCGTQLIILERNIKEYHLSFESIGTSKEEIRTLVAACNKMQGRTVPKALPTPPTPPVGLQEI